MTTFSNFTVLFSSGCPLESGQRSPVSYFRCLERLLKETLWKKMRWARQVEQRLACKGGRTERLLSIYLSIYFIRFDQKFQVYFVPFLIMYVLNFVSMKSAKTFTNSPYLTLRGTNISPAKRRRRRGRECKRRGRLGGG